MSRTVITADRVVTPDQVHAPGWVEWDGAKITGVGQGAPAGEPEIALAGMTVVPGFVDLHNHGGGGYAFDQGPTEAGRAARTHQRHGATTVVASLVTAPLSRLERSIRELAELVDDGVLAGIHLEGPWLSPTHCGAHPRGLLRSPARRELVRLLSAAPGRVQSVTLAPELEGGIEAVRQVVDSGAVAAIGHTDATYAQTKAALRAGARMGTHLHNAMRSGHHREPGPAHALLDDGGVFVELIADGVHLHPAVLRSAATWPARPVLVTDAMAGAGAPDGDYRLGGREVRVTRGQARLLEDGTLAGSTLTLDVALRYAVQSAGLPFVDAVRAATSTPASALGRADVGRLVPGAQADLVALDSEIRVSGVLRRGRWLVGPGGSVSPAERPEW